MGDEIDEELVSYSPAPETDGPTDIVVKVGDDERTTVEFPLLQEEIGFVLGAHGVTKSKVQNVSGARLSLNDGETKLLLRGTPSQCAKARDYLQLIIDQKKSKISLDLSAPRDDMTLMEVPNDCVGFIMGNRGAVLRQFEEEFGTLMFFLNGGVRSTEPMAKLAIFGGRLGRRACELKVMNKVEHKMPGWFLKSDGSPKVPFTDSSTEGAGWGCEIRVLSHDEFKYALGKGGSTRTKLAAATGTIVEFVNFTAFFVGTAVEIERSKDYLEWLLQQRLKEVKTVEYKGRPDVVYVDVPEEKYELVTGPRGEGLRELEQRTSTFVFFIDETVGDATVKRLLIFAHKERSRLSALERVKEIMAGKVRRDSGDLARDRPADRDFDRRPAIRDSRRDERFEDEPRYDSKRDEPFERRDPYDDRRGFESRRDVGLVARRDGGSRGADSPYDRRDGYMDRHESRRDSAAERYPMDRYEGRGRDALPERRDAYEGRARPAVDRRDIPADRSSGFDRRDDVADSRDRRGMYDARRDLPLESRRGGDSDRRAPIDDRRGPPIDDRRGPPIDDHRVHADDRRGHIDDRRAVLDDRRAPIDDRRGYADDRRATVEDRRVPVHDRRVVDDRRAAFDDRRATVVDDRRRPVDDRRAPAISRRTLPVAEERRTVGAWPPSRDAQDSRRTRSRSRDRFM